VIYLPTSRKGRALLYAFLLSPFFAFGQDLHFSQYDKAPTNLNPALTGVFRGDMRFNGNYKSQWYAVPVSYQTFAGTAETKFINRNQPYGYFSGGIRLFYDRAGDSKLSTTDLALTGSYTRSFGPKHLVTFGVGLGMIQRAFSTEDLRFESQWDGNQVVNYHFQIPEKRISIDAGVGLFHINEPDESFRQGVERVLPSRLSLYALGSFKVADKLDLGLSVMNQDQGPYNELLYGISGTYHLSRDKYEELAVRAGLSIRNQDALIPNIMVMYKQFTAGLSYDINSSDFKITTDQRGGPELSFSYRVTKVAPPDALKICPIY